VNAICKHYHGMVGIKAQQIQLTWYDRLAQDWIMLIKKSAAMLDATGDTWKLGKY
jgi:hypothetical protein